MKIQISILKALILKLENEQNLYLDNYRNMISKAKKARDKYKVGLRINEFLQQISTSSSLEEAKEKYANFKQESINDKIKFEDIFELDINSYNSDKVLYLIKISNDLEYYLPENASNKLFQIGEAIKSLGEKAITSSIQYFEEFFAVILRNLIIEKPEAYFYNKTIEYKQIVNSDLNKIKNDILNDEMLKLMRGVRETIEKINKNHNLKLENYKEIWEKYIEIDAHRNIIIHNSGIVNNEYNSLVTEEYKKPEGEYIKCDSALVSKDINYLIKFAFLLCYVTWNSEEGWNILIEIAFDFLCNEKWDLAKFAYMLLCKDKKQDNESKISNQINLLNAKKHLEGMEKIVDNINDLDVSGMEKKYLIAKELLLENNENVLKMINETYPDEFNAYMIIKWPIFIEFRKTKEFREFLKSHNNDFEKYAFNKQDN